MTNNANSNRPADRHVDDIAERQEQVRREQSEHDRERGKAGSGSD